MHSQEFPNISMKIKGEYYVIHTFCLNFNYCPLIWMNHNNSINKKINNLHERKLRLIYCDHSSDIEELLQRDNSVTIHQKNIEALAIMMYKVVKNIAPTIVSGLFSLFIVKRCPSVSSTICKYGMEWTGNHFICRNKNLEYRDRGNETKIIFICFQKGN